MIHVSQRVWTGIVFEPELLNEPWFLLLTAFVSLNTIIFVGLSLGKILYWPKVRIRHQPRQVKSEVTQEK
jgi:hypothetical protein